MGLFDFPSECYFSDTPLKEDTQNSFTGKMIDESALFGSDVDTSNIYRSKAFQECMTYFNNSEQTCKVLLSVQEADQNVIMQGLANKLYSHIIARVDDVDFGTIPNTKGDARKMEKYEEIRDCLNVLSQVLQNYGQSTDPVDTVIIALDNIVDRKDLFVKAYRLNAEMPIVVYNTMVLSVVSATSLLISTHIEFIKLPGNKGYDIAFDKASKLKSKDRMLFKNLEAFNAMCSSGEFDKTIEYSMNAVLGNKIRKESAEEPVSEGIISVGSALSAASAVLAKSGMAGANWLAGVVGQGAALAAAHPVLSTIGLIIVSLILLIKIIRNLIFYFYYFRTKLSDYLDIQSGLLYMNAANIRNSLSRDDREKQDIAKKQEAIAKFMKKASNSLAVKDRMAEQKAEKDSKKVDSEKYEITDVVTPAGDSGSIF